MSFSHDYSQAYDYAPATGWSLDQIVSQLNRGGERWTFSTISYSFTTSKPTASEYQRDYYGEYAGWAPFTPEQQAAAEAALDAWGDVMALKLVNLGQGNRGDILISNSNTIATYAAGFAFYPGMGVGGDLWINSYYSSNLDPYPGSYAFETLLHELGHSLGQDHPGDYDAMEGDEITYDAYAEYREDSEQYTVMSYFEARETGADHNYVYAQTPLLHDIAAIQAKYGANMSTRTGDTVYGFNSTETSQWSPFDFSVNEAPVVSIWDAGGNDTLDVSGWSVDQVIDLNEGAFSDVGGMTKNVSIAFGAAIENAVGGQGSDTIIGNALANTLSGNNGNDLMFGGEGDDILIGGAGNDTLVGGGGNDTLSGSSDRDTARYDVSSAKISVVITGSNSATVEDRSGALGVDHLTDIEVLDFASGSDVQLNILSGVANISGAELASFVEMYIAYFNRAPDAEGLFYWGTRLSEGMGVGEIAQSFYGQPETQALYTDPSDTTGFVTTVYNNFLGRDPDAEGLEYWVKQLDDGVVTHDAFLLAFISGARNPNNDSTDLDYIEGKVALGEYYAVIKGLNDTQEAKSVMDLYDGTQAGTDAAKGAIDEAYADAVSASDGALLISLVGVVDDPFSAMSA